MNAGKKILLAGHCGPDSTYLRLAVKSALGEVAMLAAEDNASLEKAIGEGVDLILFNRELGYGFDPGTGAGMIRSLKARHPELPMMLVSNYAEAQAEARAAGAVPGFGKRDIGKPRVAQVLREAVGKPLQP